MQKRWRLLDVGVIAFGALAIIPVLRGRRPGPDAWRLGHNDLVLRIWVGVGINRLRVIVPIRTCNPPPAIASAIPVMAPVPADPDIPGDMPAMAITTAVIAMIVAVTVPVVTGKSRGAQRNGAESGKEGADAGAFEHR